MVMMIRIGIAQKGKKTELLGNILEDFKLRGVVGWWGEWWTTRITITGA